MPTATDLLRFIALLLVALWAPRRMLARVRRLDRVGLWLLAKDFASMHERGERLRYPGESLATVAARIDLLVWISHDPRRALKHLVRRVRGWRRFRLGHAVQPCFAPPHAPAPVLAAGWPPLAAAPDT